MYRFFNGILQLEFPHGCSVYQYSWDSIHDQMPLSRNFQAQCSRGLSRWSIPASPNNIVIRLGEKCFSVLRRTDLWDPAFKPLSSTSILGEYGFCDIWSVFLLFSFYLILILNYVRLSLPYVEFFGPLPNYRNDFVLLIGQSWHWIVSMQVVGWFLTGKRIHKLFVSTENGCISSFLDLVALQSLTFHHKHS